MPKQKAVEFVPKPHVVTVAVGEHHLRLPQAHRHRLLPAGIDRHLREKPSQAKVVIALEIVDLHPPGKPLQDLHRFARKAHDVLAAGKEQIEDIPHQKELRSAKHSGVQGPKQPQKLVTVMGIVGIGDEESTLFYLMLDVGCWMLDARICFSLVQ